MFYVKEYADRFVEAWREIAVRFKGRKGIYGYDLMNEPSLRRFGERYAEAMFKLQKR